MDLLGALLVGAFLTITEVANGKSTLALTQWKQNAVILHVNLA
jgi:hypothetical protein